MILVQKTLNSRLSRADPYFHFLNAFSKSRFKPTNPDILRSTGDVGLASGPDPV
jgi:hypothetical protein